MRKKHVLMTLALAAATLTATGQTVTPDRETPIEAANLTANALANATTLTISGTWTAEQVTMLRMAIAGSYASGSNAVLTTVTFNPDAVMGSMKNLFYNCTALQGVTMPTAENNATVDFFQAFSGCKALTGTVDLSKFTNISNMGFAFYKCAALEGVTMPTVENNTAVDFQSAFSGCKALTGTVNLSGFTAISSMNNAFNECILLEGVTMPATNTPPATGVSFYSAFNGCKALAGTVNLSGFTAISSMSSAFSGCTALEGVTLPEANTAPSGGISFSSAFSGCKALTGTVDVSGFTNISGMNYAFYGCTGITGVKFSATENTTAGNFLSAFYGCTALQSVDLSKFTAISDMDSAFSGCTSLTSVKLGGALPATTDFAFSSANYNCLVYVPAEWTRPASGWSYIIYISGGTADGNIILEDNKPFHCPEAFALGTDYRMRYYRDLTQNQWATVCLPFAAPVPADCIAKELSSSTGETVTFAEVQTMEANKPYIVAYTGSGYSNISFISKPGATIAATPAAMETEPANASYKMAGTYADIRERSMYLLGDNSFLLYNHGNLHPFRAYITATGGAPNQAPRLAIGNEGDATGIGCIESPEAAAIPALSRVYTIDGRLVKTVPAEEYGTLKQGLERGVYIVNGKKVTVTE